MVLLLGFLVIIRLLLGGVHHLVLNLLTISHVVLYLLLRLADLILESFDLLHLLTNIFYKSVILGLMLRTKSIICSKIGAFVRIRSGIGLELIAIPEVLLGCLGQLKLMFTHLQLVNHLDQGNVFGHDALVLCLKALLIVVEGADQLLQVGLKVISLGSGLHVLVSFSSVIFQAFLFDVNLVQSDHGFLELFIIVNVMQGLENVIFEQFDFLILLINLFLQLHAFLRETGLLEPQVVHDQFEVLADSGEVLNFLVHLSCTLVKLLDILFTGSDVAL